MYDLIENIIPEVLFVVANARKQRLRIGKSFHNFMSGERVRSHSSKLYFLEMESSHVCIPSAESPINRFPARISERCISVSLASQKLTVTSKN